MFFIVGIQLFILAFSSQSLKSCVSEGIRAVDDRLSKQEDIRRKKVQQTNYYLGKILTGSNSVFDINPKKIEFKNL